MKTTGMDDLAWKQNSRFWLSVLVVCTSLSVAAQGADSLQRQINRIVAGKRAKVGLAIYGNDGRDTLSLNGGQHFPMQSVFKFHIGLALLAQVDKGMVSAGQAVRITENDLANNLYSPLRRSFPHGGSFSVSQLLEYMVSQSDNAACDALLRVIGGPAAVDAYFKQLGCQDISIRINEAQMQSSWSRQFENWTTPLEANRVLRRFYENKEGLLSAPSHGLIWKVMQLTSTGKDRLKGRLPEGTVVAHKTGWSGRNDSTGVTAAVNDIGVVFLPDGRWFYISVFVTDCREDLAAGEQIIADIARAAWDYFLRHR